MTSSKRKDESIKTYLRIKPTFSTQQPYYSIVSPSSIVIKGQQEYTYDRIFDAQSTNQDMFQQIGQPLIKHCMEGYNACVLAYGQTSSGKTYTMKGVENNEGLIPLTLRQMFRTIQDQNLLAEIRISYLQIYNQNIIDLLNSAETCLQIREDPRKNITIIGLNQIRVSKAEEAMKLLQFQPYPSQQGESRRKFASNNLNVASSRSHAIFRMNVEIVHEDFSKTNSCINMVDLAGSEGVSRTKAQGNVKKEGQNINKSILALSNVIRCMSEKQSYVNFRDSKLTRILQSSLCNNSRSVVICNIYPTALNYQQTINTLKFGMYASEVKLELKRNVTQVNQNSHKFQASQAKDGTVLQDQIFEPKQRIEYVENKRIISQLRQENQELRDYKRILNEKIEFLELENHRMMKNFENLEQKFKTKKFQATSLGEINNEERQEYEKRIKQLKGQMQVMADKYEAINEYSSKLQKNQRYLIERITKYESQIAMLKETISSKQMENLSRNQSKAKTPVKPKHYKFNRNNNQDVCPLTIGSIIILKAHILELKQVVYGLNQEVAGLVEERNQFLAQIEEFKENQLRQRTESQQVYYTEVQKKQIKNLHIRIKQLKNENHLGRIRQKKLARMLKECSQTWIEQMDQFNEWYAEKKKRLDSIKKQRSGSAKKSYQEN